MFLDLNFDNNEMMSRCPDSCLDKSEAIWEKNVFGKTQKYVNKILSK